MFTTWAVLAVTAPLYAITLPAAAEEAGERAWQAEVLWCSALTPGRCAFLLDNLGPHPVRSDCEERAQEMLKTAGQRLGPPLHARWRCRDLQSAELPARPGKEYDI